MQFLRLTLYLLQVPRLLLSLIIFPVILAFGTIILQLISSVFFLSYLSSTETKKLEESLNNPRRTTNWVRDKLLGANDYEDTLKVCYWSVELGGKLKQPTTDCTVDRYDIVIDPKLATPDKEYNYMKLFLGFFRKVHICQGCVSDIMISKVNGETQIDFGSLFALSLFTAVEITEEYRNNFSEAVKSLSEFESLTGDKYLRLTGFVQKTKLSTLTHTLILVSNISVFIIVCLWLALKAHRKVLDYFSHSGALLPLVAASGKNNFYLTIWSLTIIRVIAFTLTALPVGIYMLSDAIGQDLLNLLFLGDLLLLSVWIVTIIISLTLTTIIASLAELKSNSALLSIRYKLFPLLLCFLGGVIWIATFAYEAPITFFIRDLILTLPLISIPALLMCPVFPPHPLSMAFNAILTLIFTIFTVRRNAEWFGSHLEEI
jgi:hypothetical protein